MISDVRNIDCVAGMAEFPDKFFDLCVTDPPYGVGLEYNTYDDTLENWRVLMDKFIPEVRRVCKMVIMPSCSIKKLGWIYEHHEPDWLMCWDKGSPGHNSWMGFNDWEPLLVYGKTDGCCMHDKIKLTNQVPMGEYGHPCPKPVLWSKKLMLMALPNGRGRVLDCFLGSGSSRIAAYDIGFDFWGFELDKDYYEASEQRFKRHIAQQVLPLDVQPTEYKQGTMDL